MKKSNNSINVPEARQAMDQFKQQAASELGAIRTTPTAISVTRNMETTKSIIPTATPTGWTC